MRRDYLEPEDFRPVRRRRKKNRIWTWALLLGGVGIVSIAIATVIAIVLTREKLAEPKVERGRPMTECRVGDTASFGDVSLTVLSVRVAAFEGQVSAPQGEETVHYDPHLLVKIRLKNFNPNRIVKVPPQAGGCRAKDDVGNDYAPLEVVSQGRPVRVPEMLAHGVKTDLRSDESPTYDTLVFKRPVEGAKSVVIALNASAFGGTGTLLVKADRAEWDR